MASHETLGYVQRLMVGGSATVSSRALSNGVQGGRAIALLNALIGSIDRPGTMLIPDKRDQKYMGSDADETAAATLKQPRFDELSKYALGHSSAKRLIDCYELRAAPGRGR